MEGYAVHASDGRIGKVHEFVFDTNRWALRYLVVDLGGWITGRKVLLAAAAIRHAEPGELVVNVSKEQVRNSPDIDVTKQMPRSVESELHDHYGWPYYWQQPTYYDTRTSNPITHDPYAAPTWPADTTPESAKASYAAAGSPVKGSERNEPAEPLMRESREVHGYHIHAQDGDIGHVHDFAVEDENWIIRYLIIDTRNFLPGKHIAVSPKWVRQVNWEDRRVYLCLTKEQIEKAPRFDEQYPISRAYEEALFEHYGTPKYWEC